MILTFTSDAPTSKPGGGYVYVIDFGRKVKIGKSNNPARRVRTIETQSGEKALQVMFSQHLEDPGAFEREAHSIFADDRKLGEYFAVSFDEIISTLKEHTFRLNEGEVQRREPDISGLTSLYGFFRLKEMKAPVRNIYAPIAASIALEVMYQSLELFAKDLGYEIPSRRPVAHPESELVSLMAKEMLAAHERVFDESMIKDFGKRISDYIFVEEGNIRFKRA